MPIDPIPPSVFREAAPFSLSQVAPTNNDRESQAEGEPPLEVSAAEQQVLRWMRHHLPSASRRRSRLVRKPGLDAVELDGQLDGETQISAADAGAEHEEAPPALRISVTDGGEEPPQENGTQFDVLL